MQDQPLITVTYEGAHGASLDEPADVHIKQQPAGGADVTVFRGPLRPGATVTFESRRNPQFPLGLAIFVNGSVGNQQQQQQQQRRERGGGDGWVLNKQKKKKG